jgi:hypothetical protein
VWNPPPETVTAGYARALPFTPCHLSRCGHEEPASNLGGPPSKVYVHAATDSAQYREGTVKSTPARGVKQTLNSCASMPLEG